MLDPDLASKYALHMKSFMVIVSSHTRNVEENGRTRNVEKKGRNTRYDSAKAKHTHWSTLRIV